MNKVYEDAESALSEVLRDGMSVMVGGFGLGGVPEHLLRAIQASGVKNLTVISNNMGTDDWGAGLLAINHQIGKVIASFLGGNKVIESQILAGEVELELVPQGSFVERIRAGGAGIPGFYTATGVGTLIAEGRETREFDGKQYLLETALRADLALIKAWKADTRGNLSYRKTSRNTNPVMVAACDLAIVEVEQMVVAGGIDPDLVHTPGIYVDRLFVGKAFEKRVEFLTNRPREVHLARESTVPAGRS